MSLLLWVSCATLPLTCGAIAWLDARRWWHRALMMCGVLLLFLMYLAWRITQTVMWGNLSFVGLYTQIVMFIEFLWFFDVAHCLHFYAYPQRQADASLPLTLRHAVIDVIVPTYNEPAHVLERTLMAAKNLAWIGAVQVHVLDDGKREWLPALCKTWGATYLSRPDNQSAKAGNINHALRYMHGDFTLVLDADFMVDPQAVEKLIGPMSDPSVAVVQAPQEFYNPDPIQRSLGIGSISPTDQSFFFNNVLQVRNNGNAAFFCGTCGLIRNSALKALGGFPTESITEDIFLSLKLSGLGYRSVSIAEPVAVGMSPETIDDLFKQRSRWGLGAIQMNARLWIGQQAWLKEIPVITKLKFLPVYWLMSFPVRMVSMMLPQCFFLLGWQALVNASLLELVVAQGSLAIALWYFNLRVSGRTQQPFITSIWHDMLALRLTPIFMARLFSPFAELKFVVTPKGQSGTQPQGHARWFDWYVTFLLVMTALAIVIGVFQHASTPLSDVSLFWTLINFVRILFVHAALRHEQPVAPFEMAVQGCHMPSLWLEGGDMSRSVSQCTLSESRVLDRSGRPVAHALMQLNTNRGLSHIGQTQADGTIHFFSDDKKSVWISHLVAASLRKLNQPDAPHAMPWRALLRTLKTSMVMR